LDGNGKPSLAWLSALGGALLLLAFLFTLRDFLTPMVGFVALTVFYFALRDKTARPIFFAATAILVMWGLSQVGNILAPLFIALALAYILRPLVALLEGRKLSRAAASGIVLAVVIVVTVVAGILIIPQLVGQVGELISKVVASAPTWRAWIETTIFSLLTRFPVDPEKLQTLLLQELPSQLQAVFAKLLQGVLNLTAALSGVLGQIVNVILVPVLAYYFMKDYGKGREVLLAYIPETHRDNVVNLLERADDLMSGFLRGQLLVMLAVGVLTALGLWIAGVPYALFLGAMTGLLNIIPFLGLYISLALALAVALFAPEPVSQIIRVVIVFVIVQGLEGAVLSPKIVGDRVGLHPIWVIISVFIAAQFLGFVGLILGVPLAALLKVVFNYKWHKAAPVPAVQSEGEK
jgi:predicted PurR-regulated permease PerM